MKELKVGERVTITLEVVEHDDSEDREVVKDCLKDWLEINCEQEKDLGGYPDWKSAVVE
jgi:hypothetical protein